MLPDQIRCDQEFHQFEIWWHSLVSVKQRVGQDGRGQVETTKILRYREGHHKEPGLCLYNMALILFECKACEYLVKSSRDGRGEGRGRRGKSGVHEEGMGSKWLSFSPCTEAGALAKDRTLATGFNWWFTCILPTNLLTLLQDQEGLGHTFITENLYLLSVYHTSSKLPSQLQPLCRGMRQCPGQFDMAPTWLWHGSPGPSPLPSSPKASGSGPTSHPFKRRARPTFPGYLRPPFWMLSALGL